MHSLIFIIIFTCSIIGCNKEHPLKIPPKLLTVEEFNKLNKQMLTDEEKEFDELWSEMKARFYFTLQSEGIEFYTLEDRSKMAWDLRFHDGLNSEYVTKKHGTSIRGIVSLLEWAEMNDFELEQDRQKMKLDNKELRLPTQ